MQPFILYNITKKLTGFIIQKYNDEGSDIGCVCSFVYVVWSVEVCNK